MSPTNRVRYDNFDTHNRLKDDRLRLTRRFLKRHRCGDLEGDFRGVNVVIRTIVRSTEMSTIGIQARNPLAIASRAFPFSTGEINSWGTTPPLILLMNSKWSSRVTFFGIFFSGSIGSIFFIRIFTWPY